MSTFPPSKYQRGLLFAVLVAALALRLWNLGAAPLTEAEAELAVPAYQITQDQLTALGDQPAYVILTTALFSLFGATNVIARLAPAIFGSALVLLPWAWREEIGRKAAFVLALGLALDPGLLAFSRAASGVVIGISAALWALTAWRQRQGVWAGLLTVIALYSAPVIYIGLLAAGLAWLAFPRFASQEDRRSLGALVAGEAEERRSFLVSASLTILLGASLLMRLPAGLAGITGPLAGFIQGLAGGGAALSLFLLAILAYGLMPVVFGRVVTLAEWRQQSALGRFLLIWATAALLLILVNPGRQLADLLWVLLPLWVLAAQRLAGYLAWPPEERLVALGQALLLLLLGSFLILNLARLSALAVGTGEFNARLLTAGAVVLLAALASIMIALGWSRVGSAYGIAWALAAFFLMAMISAGWRLALRPASTASDLWLPGPAAGQADLLAQVVEDISEMDSGELRQAVVERKVDSAALAWLLRDYPQPGDAVGDSPAMIISGGEETQPAEGAAYRGQSFVWSSQPAWSGDWPPNIFDWLLYRQAPVEGEEIILWAREDIFPGQLDASESDTSAEAESP